MPPARKKRRKNEFSGLSVYDERIGPNLPKEKKAKRTCLRCQKKFDSWGVANRMCECCLKYVNESMRGGMDTTDVVVK